MRLALGPASEHAAGQLQFFDQHSQFAERAAFIVLGRCTLAFWAVPIAAGVVGDRRIGAVLTARDMAAEGCGAAALDRRHHLELAEAHMAGIGLTPSRPIVAENVRDLPAPDGARDLRARRAVRPFRASD